jgi:hypothetical protein
MRRPVHIFGIAVAALTVAAGAYATPEGNQIPTEHMGVIVAAGRFAEGPPYRITVERGPAHKGRLAGLYVRITGRNAREASGGFPLMPQKHQSIAVGGTTSCTSSRQYVIVTALVPASADRHIWIEGHSDKRLAMHVPRLPRKVRLYGWVFAYAALEWPPSRIVAQVRHHTISTPVDNQEPQRRCQPGESKTFGELPT